MKLKYLLVPPAAAFFLSGCPRGSDAAGPPKGGGMPPAPVITAVAVKKDMPFEVRTFGNVEAIATVAVKAQVGGELIKVHFKEGEQVEAKQLLFTIQPRLYETQRKQAEANLERDRAAAANAVLALKRQEALDAKGAGVKEELEKARTLVDSTAAVVRADEALLLIAQTQEGYATIEAPMAGRTGAIRVREGNVIKLTDDEPLTTIVQTAPIYVTFALPEEHLAALRRGLVPGGPELKVVARDSKDGRVLGEGKVTFIANTVDTSTGTITAKAEFLNKDEALWPGAFVDVSVTLGEDKGALVVPSSAVMVGQNGQQVLIVAADSTAESRAVKVLRAAGVETIIQEGVAAGETVISSGQSRVIPGGKVVPKNHTESAPPAAVPAGTAPAPAGSAPAGKPAEPGDASGKPLSGKQA